MNDYNIFFNNYLDIILQISSFAANFGTVNK
jgi:hypothetical protein